MTATAELMGHKLEARPGEDNLYHAYIDGEPAKGVKASKYGRVVIKWAVEALKQAENDRQTALYREVLQQEQLRKAYLENK